MPIEHRFRTAVFYCMIFLLSSPFPLEAPHLQATEQTETIRQSILSGTWYPKDSQVLRQEIIGYLKTVPAATTQDRLMGLIVPHAGYRYSGQVAAHAYKLLEAHRFETVVVIAPSHRIHFKGVSVYDRGGYETPLGIIPLDYELISILKLKDSRIHYVPKAHQAEHSLEIQLPFIQTLLPNAKLVPLVMGDQQLETSLNLARILSECVGDKSVLLIASTDLSHYHSYEQAKKLDQRVMERISAMDVQGLYADLAFGMAEACGGGPMIATMTALKWMGANRIEVRHAANSGDVTGDRSRVVGYMAAALWKNSIRPVNILGLDRAEKELLLNIARQSVESVLLETAGPKIEDLTSRLKEKRGAFVTIHTGNRLRGCIGHLSGKGTLAETVSNMAISAAFQDPRFPPVRKEELPGLTFEISILSPLQKIDVPQEIRVGTHGLLIKQGERSGLLLPQVAVDHQWDPMTFLEQTCQKAGLDRNSWRDPKTEIYRFSAEVF